MKIKLRDHENATGKLISEDIKSLEFEVKKNIRKFNCKLFRPVDIIEVYGIKNNADLKKIIIYKENWSETNMNEIENAIKIININLSKALYN